MLRAFLAAAGFDDEARNLVERARQRRLDDLGRVAEALGGGDQRPERSLDGYIEVERDAVDRAQEALGTGVAQADSLDRHPRRE
ncbi:MAG TPA: hypothetical protein VFO32_07265, partial [Sphingomicrobium sp.]|nr:hypothetical protein [Sphingomicrobium sp.]